MELEPGAEFTSDGQRYTINAVDHVPAHGEYADCFTVYADAVTLLADESCDCGSCGECLGTMNPYVEEFYKQLEDTLTADEANALVDCNDCGGCDKCWQDLSDSELDECFGD